MNDDNFNGWPIVQEVPDGWGIDKTTGSPLAGHVFITNGKSVLNGQKRALLQVNKSMAIKTPPKLQPHGECEESLLESGLSSYDQQVADIGFRRTVNEMARERFKLNLLRDIMCDLTICEIEGWCKVEYINQMKKMINEIGKCETIILN